MSSHRQNLKAFVQPVFICTLPIDVDGIIAQLHSETTADIAPSPTESVTSERIDHIIVVDHEASPLGCIPIATLLKANSLLKSVNTEQLIEPMRCLPAGTSLQEFWHTLQALPPGERVHWGITDLAGKDILGLLDLPQILPALAHIRSPSGTNLIPNDSKTNGKTAKQLEVEQLILASRLKDNLLSEISHDLKNPLTAILGLFNILQQSKLEQITERQNRYLELIDDKTHQLMTVVQKVMLMSQLQNQQFTLQLEVIEINLLCQQAIESYTQLSPTDTQSSPKIKLRIQEQIPTLIADQGCLNKILCALMQQIGVLPNTPMTIQVEQWGGWIGFSISTDQADLSVEQARLITQQPDRFPYPTAENNPLDLHLANQLAHLHRGVICVTGHSIGNRQLTLLIPPNLATLPAAPAHIAQLSQQIALIIATDIDIIAVLQKFLESQGYRVAIAQSGSEALALPQQLQPAVIFIHQAFALPSGSNIFQLIETNCQITPILIGTPAQQQTTQPCIGLPITHEAIAACLANLPIDASDSNVQSHRANTTENDHDLATAEVPPPRTQLTILHLETSAIEPLSSDGTTHSQVFNIKGCQVISIASLEEAPLLLQLWKPQVILYTGTDLTPLQQLEQQPSLAQLPLVVTDPEIAAQARQIPSLKVYECPISSTPQSHEVNSNALVHILQIAAARPQASPPMA